jgi:hypothetical protein
MKFVAVKTTNDFQIAIADYAAAKPGEEPGTRKGEPHIIGIGVDEDGDQKGTQFYASDALEKDEIQTLKKLLAKLSAHTVSILQ